MTSKVPPPARRGHTLAREHVQDERENDNEDKSGHEGRLIPAHKERDVCQRLGDAVGCAEGGVKRPARRARGALVYPFGEERSVDSKTERPAHLRVVERMTAQVRHERIALAVSAAVTGVATWFHGEGIAWLWGGLVIFAVVPFTLLVIRPTNNRLLAPGRDLASAETRRLLERWGRLHAVRSTLGLAASIVYLYALAHI